MIKPWNWILISNHILESWTWTWNIDFQSSSFQFQDLLSYPSKVYNLVGEWAPQEQIEINSMILKSKVRKEKRVVLGVQAEHL